MHEVIPKPKSRSPKWLSTSVPRNEWKTTTAQLSSAEYHVNNLLSSVLFEETFAQIPNDAVTIEIAPHGLLQAILRRSLDPSVTNVALTQRGHSDNVKVVLQAIGKLYNLGLQPKLTNLYPEVNYPVSRGTPMISPLVRWDHSDDWFVAKYGLRDKIVSGERVVKLSLTDPNYKHLEGHTIDGSTMLSATGYLSLIWELVGMMNDRPYSDVSVIFENVTFYHAITTVPKEGVLELSLIVQEGKEAL